MKFGCPARESEFPDSRYPRHCGGGLITWVRRGAGSLLAAEPGSGPSRASRGPPGLFSRASAAGPPGLQSGNPTRRNPISRQPANWTHPGPTLTPTHPCSWASSSPLAALAAHGLRVAAGWFPPPESLAPLARLPVPAARCAQDAAQDAAVAARPRAARASVLLRLLLRLLALLLLLVVCVVVLANLAVDAAAEAAAAAAGVRERAYCWLCRGQKRLVRTMFS